MYLFYISSIGFIIVTILRCAILINNRPKPKFKKLDDKINHLFVIQNIEFFKDDKLIKIIEYNSNVKYLEQRNIELNVNFLYDYFIVNYTHNSKHYKYYSENSFFTFPIYSEDQIKNYVYINKILRAVLYINNEEFNILNIILPFVGPNYNFYNDLDIKLNIKNILKHKINLSDNNFSIKLYDNFSNEYNINSDFFNWNPELKL